MVQSKINDGTSIHLQLPISQPLLPQNAENKEEQLSNNKQSKILVIEDKDDLRLTLVEQLYKLGYLPLFCASGEEAISVLNDEKGICYLLSDIVLTGKMTGITGKMTGIDVAKFVQENHPKIKILLMTGHTEQLEKTKNFPVLTKPFRQKDLMKALQHL